MALARTRRDRGIDYWPGFVDALSTLILGIIFLLSIFVVVQFFLSQEVTGKDTALARLNAQIAQLTELLSMEKSGKASLEDNMAALRASLAAAESDRDRFKGLYEGIGPGAAQAQGKVNALTSELDSQKQISARALSQVELLNQQIAALRRQLSAIEEVLQASEKKDREAQAHEVPVGHHDVAGTLGRMADGQNPEAAAVQGVGGVGHLDRLGVGRRWVLEGGIMVRSRWTRWIMLSCGRCCGSGCGTGCCSV